MNRALNYAKLEGYSDSFKKNKNTIMANALAKNEIQSVVVNGQSLQKINYSFSDEIATLKVTNQKSSGRCWIFAGLNVMREAVVKRFNLENFEIS